MGSVEALCLLEARNEATVASRVMLRSADRVGRSNETKSLDDDARRSASIRHPKPEERSHFAL